MLLFNKKGVNREKMSSGSEKLIALNSGKWYLLLIKQKQMQNDQNLSEWNHGWKTGKTKVHVLTYFQNLC